MIIPIGVKGEHFGANPAGESSQFSIDVSVRLLGVMLTHVGVVFPGLHPVGIPTCYQSL